MSEFGGVPERWKEEGIYVHGRELVKVGDEVEAIGDVLGVITRGTRLRVDELIVEPNGQQRGFTRRLGFVGIDGIFNPKRFIKVKVE